MSSMIFSSQRLRGGTANLLDYFRGMFLTNTVVALVRASLHKSQVARGVVHLIFVDVMNYLSGAERASDFLLHDKSMLTDVPEVVRSGMFGHVYENVSATGYASPEPSSVVLSSGGNRVRDIPTLLGTEFRIALTRLVFLSRLSTGAFHIPMIYLTSIKINVQAPGNP